MQGGSRGSEWVTLRRALAILQRLSAGPADGNELIAAVLATVGPEAYPDELSARRSAFKRDRDNLRKHLEVEFGYDPRSGQYTLQDPGSFGALALPLAGLRALQFLSQAFDSELGERAEVQDLIDHLVSRLSAADRLRLERGTPSLEIDIFQSLDEQPVDEHVWAVVRRAKAERRKLAFNYLSPRHADRLPRYHEVAPYWIGFRRGHWYLYAYDLLRREPSGLVELDSGHKNFRLTNIQPDERLAVLPSMLPPARRRPPRFRVHYRLLPPLGRGSISRHFDEMQVQRLPDGSAEVQGYTENDWEAARILLAYGENCLVLGGDEVLKRVQRAARGMARHYGYLDDWTPEPEKGENSSPARGG